MTFQTFVFRVMLLSFITGVSADGLGIAYGSLYMQHDVKDSEKLESAVHKVAHEMIETEESVLKRFEELGILQPYELTLSDMDRLHECYYFKYFRNWHGNDTKLSQQDEFCKRLVDNRPASEEATTSEMFRRFLAMSEAFKKFSPSKPFYPTRHEMLEMEDCYFSQSQEEKKINISQLSGSEAFCQRLKHDLLNQMEIPTDGSFYPFAPYHNYWHDLLLVARKDFAQILQCHNKMFNQRFSGPCKGYYKLIHKSTSTRDFRRKHVDTCMRMQHNQKLWTINKTKCSKIIDQYKKVYCGF